MRRSLPLLPLALAPVVLLRGSLAPGRIPGQPFGEGWGHLFAMGQLGRWLCGEARLGQADLLAYPDGMRFWPVDPLTTLLASSLDIIAGRSAHGGAAALSVTVLLLVTLTGVGAWLLARSLGAKPWAASAAALAIQLHPFLLRSASDTIVEVLALGPLLILGALAVRLWENVTPRRLLASALAMLATALCSPYYAIYAMILWAALLPWAMWRRKTPRWLGLGGVLLVAGALAAAPLLWAESGPGGRMDERFGGGGFQLSPSGQVLLSERGAIEPAPRSVRGPGPGPTSVRAAGHSGEQGTPPAWMWLARRFPGGLCCMVALLMGLAVRRSRPLAVLALVMFALGAGPPLIRHAMTPGPSDVSSPLQELLQLLPMTDRIGNAQRLVLLYALPALVAGGVAAASRWPLAVLLGAVAIAESWMIMPALRLPHTEISVDTALLEQIDGPVVTFPMGDPPTWNPQATPKRALYLATLHGGATAGDYGRGRLPADLGLVATLSAWARAPLAPQAAKAAAQGELPAPAPQGFAWLLVLHESLDSAQIQSLHQRAEQRWGAPAMRSDWGAVYPLGATDQPDAGDAL